MNRICKSLGVSVMALCLSIGFIGCGDTASTGKGASSASSTATTEKPAKTKADLELEAIEKSLNAKTKSDLKSYLRWYGYYAPLFTGTKNEKQYTSGEFLQPAGDVHYHDLKITDRKEIGKYTQLKYTAVCDYLDSGKVRSSETKDYVYMIYDDNGTPKLQPDDLVEYTLHKNIQMQSNSPISIPVINVGRTMGGHTIVVCEIKNNTDSKILIGWASNPDIYLIDGNGQKISSSGYKDFVSYCDPVSTAEIGRNGSIIYSIPFNGFSGEVKGIGIANFAILNNMNLPTNGQILSTEAYIQD